RGRSGRGQAPFGSSYVPSPVPPSIWYNLIIRNTPTGVHGFLDPAGVFLPVHSPCSMRYLVRISSSLGELAFHSHRPENLGALFLRSHLRSALGFVPSSWASSFRVT